MPDTPVTGFPLLEQNQGSAYATANFLWLIWDALVPGAYSLVTNDPPGSPAESVVVRVGTVPTGVFIGHANAIAIYVNSAWYFIDPTARHEGWQLYDQTADIEVRWDGTAWV